MDRRYKRTLYASYLAGVCQAIVVNLAPLLFVTFRKEFDISVGKISFLVTYNFLIQLLVDFLSAQFVDRIGCKKCIVAAQVFCAVGLVGLGQFPFWLPDPYAGLLLATTVYAIGGGLIEVLTSPIVEALPLERKSSAMSLLHSFYAWGSALVVLLSTMFLKLAGTGSWRLLSLLWAAVPVFNVFLYAGAPIRVLTAKGERVPMRKLFSVKLFWLFALLVLCAGAAEQAMGQWASYFAETGLQVEKTVGDLLGPCLFAALMGVSRLFYGIMGERIPLKKFLLVSGTMCAMSFLVSVFSPLPLLSLMGCGICGLSVGMLWPGMLSVAAETYPQGSTTMFALLALAGDMGCSSGPTVVGAAAGLFGDQLKAGLLVSTAFPIIFALGIQCLLKKNHTNH